MKSPKSVIADASTYTDQLFRNITLELEPDMWRALDEICWREQSSIEAVCNAVGHIKDPNLSLGTAIGLFILDYFRLSATEEGHQRAGHGANNYMAPASSNLYN